MNELFAQLRTNLLRQFRGVADLEDIVQEALLRTHLRLSRANDIQDIPAFAAGVARNVVLENLRGTYSFQGFARDAGPKSASLPAEPELSLVDLQKLARTVLSTSERKLFREYFKAGGKRNRLAGKHGVTVGNLYVIAYRLKQRLIAEHRRTRGIQA